MTPAAAWFLISLVPNTVLQWQDRGKTWDVLDSVTTLEACAAEAKALPALGHSIYCFRFVNPDGTDGLNENSRVEYSLRVKGPEDKK